MNLPKFKFSSLIIVGFLFILSKPTFVSAQIFFGTASEGAGETGRASIDSFDTHFMNPAALPFTTSNTIGGAYQMTRPDGDQPISTSAFLVTDNGPQAFVAAAVAYVNKRSSFPDHIITDQDFSISVGARILQKLSAGVFAHRLVRQNTNGPSWAKHNISVGLLMTPAPFLNLAFTSYDILTDDDLDMIPVIALGSEVNIMNIFKFRTDITRQEKKNPAKAVGLNSGLEFDLSQGFLLRTGGIWDTLYNQTYWTIGLGWLGPRLSAAYAFKTNLNVAHDFAHTFQLWLTF